VKALKHYALEYPLRFTVVGAVSMVFISGVLVLASLQGWPKQIFRFMESVQQELPIDTDVAGWASFDRDSYAVGEIIKYRVRVLYRNDKIVPDLEQFERSLSFTPIEKRESVKTRGKNADNVNDYTLEYSLQGVDVLSGTMYHLDPVVLFYKQADSTTRELQSIRIETPSVFFTESYPGDVAKIPLKAMKRQINEAYQLRRGLMTASGSILFALVIFVLWRYGRRRSQQELTETEKIWQEFRAINAVTLNNREYLFKCEKIITRLFLARAGLNPAAFWLCKNPSEAYWKDLVIRLRQILDKIYCPSGLSHEDVDEVTRRLNDTFSETVAEDKLILEAAPSFIVRLKQQPRILVLSSTCFGLGVIMFSLVSFPGIWLSSEVVNYNDLIEVLTEAPLIEESVPFIALSEQSDKNKIKAAALYNAGTIKAHLKPSSSPPLQELELLEIVFQPDKSLESYIENEASLEMFFASAGWLRSAKQNLQDAVRADPYDEDIIRNLELVSKRYAAVMAAINSLFAAAQATPDNSVKSKLETMVDVLNLEWPEDVEEKDKEDKKSPTYKISEKF